MEQFYFNTELQYSLMDIAEESSSVIKSIITIAFIIIKTF
jgi:hypothetical protein